MKQLRYILIAAFVTIGIFSTVLYTSCSKSKCGSVTCANGGTCSGSTCICPTGYSGPSCGTGWTDVVVGTYNCSRSDCSPAVVGPTTWVSAVTKDASYGGYVVNVSNFDNSNITVAAVIDSMQNVRIAPASGGYGISATGKMVNNVITMNFTTTSVGGVSGYTCKMTLTKQ